MRRAGYNECSSDSTELNSQSNGDKKDSQTIRVSFLLKQKRKGINHSPYHMLCSCWRCIPSSHQGGVFSIMGFMYTYMT